MQAKPCTWSATIALLLVLLSSTAVTADASAAKSKDHADPLDWTPWRGPQQDGSSLETGLIQRWDTKGGDGSNLLWKRDDLGSRSTPIVLRGKLYTLVRDEPATPREGEKVVCVDAATGETLWEHRFNVYLSDVPDTRVGWSCVVGDPTTGHVYAQGVCGYFVCLDGETGEVIWNRSLHEEYGLLSTYGGRTNVPVVFEDLVIASTVVIGWGEMAKPAHRFMAFNKQTGEIVWFRGTRLIPYDTTYSTPTVTVLDGQAAMVFGSGDGAVWALQPRTGEPIWNYPFSRRGLNVSPLVAGNIVYMSHSEENMQGTAMGGLVAIDGTGSGDLSGKELWRLEDVMAGKASPLLMDDRLYVIDDRAKLLIFDPKTGQQIARQPLRGRMQRSSPLAADGKIYTCTLNGSWSILEPTKKGVRFVQKLRLPSGDLSDGSPIVSHGRIYVPTSQHLFCIGQQDAKPAAKPAPPTPQERPVDEDPQPAQVQVVPCEVLLRPGEKQQFTVRLFNARGQFLKETRATFSLEGAGEITSDGLYTASTTGHEAAIVQCKAGPLTGQARVRVVPPLPWKWDFEDLDDVPITWIGGRVRHEVRDVDGNKVLVKRDRIPTRPGQFTQLGTRSRTWMGQIDLRDYTIEADVQGKIQNGKMPDIGLINQRYTMELQGASQKLQVRTWCTQLRMARTVEFPWQPNVWYTMKLATSVQDGKAVVRGKVWPRGQEEPEAWTVEAVDESPNRSGSPGLFGNATDAEFYLDNISITPN